MRLASLNVDQLPGIDGPLRVAGLTPGVTVIVGPNASGKSSLLRALLALLYPREHDGVIAVEAQFLTAAGSTLMARRLGQDVAWEHDGEHGAAPDLPAYHLVGAYTLRLEDLVAAATAAPSVRRGPGRSAAAGRSDLDGGSELDRHIADSIVKQLTGGIDLEAVRRGIGGQSEAGRKLAGAVRAAAKELAGLQQRRAALQEREAKLPALRAELEAARAAARQGHEVDDAALLLAARTEAAELDAEAATYPPDLDRLRGDEGESLAKLHAASRGETTKLEASGLEVEELRRSLDAAGLRPDLSATEVSLHLERAERLVEDDAKLAQKTSERQALLAQFREAGRRVGAAPDEPRTGDIGVSDKTMQRVEELLEQRQAARAEEQALLRQRSRLPPAPPAARGSTDDQLVRLRVNLLRWLSAPPSEPRRPAWTWGLALALVTAVVGAGTLGASGTVLLALAGATSAWLLSAWLLIPPMASAVRHQVEAETHQARAQHGVGGPVAWEHAEVADLVAAVDAELAERARRAADERQRSMTERGIDADLAAARAKADEVQRELDALRATHGFAVGPDVLLASWLHAVRDLTRVRTALSGVQVEGSRLDARVTAATAELRSFLAGAGQESAAPAFGEPADHRPERLRAALRTLARAVDQRDADRLRLASLENDRDRSRAELARLAGERRQLFTAAGLDGGPEADDELLGRLALLPAWRGVSQRRRTGEARLATLGQRVAGNERLIAMVEGGDHAALEEAAAACRAAQSRADDLSRAIDQTEREIELAASDRSIGLTAARLAEAAAELSAHREEAVRLAAARFLLGTVEAEHRSEARPPALARAATLFERFTRGEFVLRFESAEGSRRRLAAADRSGRVLELQELSTGTRAQLLIASRLAFALEAEAAAASAVGDGAADGAGAIGTAIGAAIGAALEPGGDPGRDGSSPTLVLPFFLDEALTTSDPQRFAAVAAAILDVAAVEGRQFIYLSARSDDAELWRRAAAAHGSTIGVVQLASQGAGKAASPAAN